MSAPAAAATSTPQQDEAAKAAAALDAALTKYKVAGDIGAKALKAVIAAAKAGATVGQLCKVGDDAVAEGTGAVYKSDKKLAKVRARAA